MTWRHYTFLFLASLIILGFVSAFQSGPGYMDADYYYAGGIQIATGHGFNEPYLWNYLDNPQGLPHPSHSYWMPLASILAALGMVLFRSTSFIAAKGGFLLIAALIPPLSSALAWYLSHRKDLAIFSGILAIFSGYYLVYLTTTDTFGIYMLLGGLLFLYFTRERSTGSAIIAGVLIGFMNLTRSDGIIWLGLSILYIIINSTRSKELRVSLFYKVGIVVGGYLIIMLPWFMRNIMTFGTLFGPGSGRVLWLTSYNQIFSYPPSHISFGSWVQSGFKAVLDARLWALGINLASALTVQGGIVLFPLVVLGILSQRKHSIVWLGVGGWGATLGVMTILFPFAGARGGFFHSGSALQVFWWCLIPIGLDEFIKWGIRVRNWELKRSRKLFTYSITSFVIILTIWISATKLGINGLKPWGQEENAYSHISNILKALNISKKEIIIVANPPGFWLESRHPSIAVPSGDITSLTEVSQEFHANYLILEKSSLSQYLFDLYSNPEKFKRFIYMGEVEDARIFKIAP